MVCDPYEHWRELAEPGVFFSLSGAFSQDLLVEVCETVIHRLQEDASDPGTTMKVQAVIVELLQNIIRYSAQKVSGGGADGEEQGIGSISVGHREGHYTVSSGNLVENAHVPQLQSSLTRLQAMDRGELRQHFLERRKNKSAATSRGAGLGLIDLARKSAEPIRFEFHPVDDVRSFFCIKIVI